MEKEKAIIFLEQLIEYVKKDVISIGGFTVNNEVVNIGVDEEETVINASTGRQDICFDVYNKELNDAPEKTNQVR